MKTPTIEQIDALIRREFPGYRLDPGSKIEVADGRVTTYRGEVPERQSLGASERRDPRVLLKP